MTVGFVTYSFAGIRDSWPQRGTVGELNTLIQGGRWWKKEFEAGQCGRSTDYGKLKTLSTYCSASPWSGSGSSRNRVSVGSLV